jgi:hypothetical protein
MSTEHNQLKSGAITPEPSNKVIVPIPTGNVPFSSPCLLGSDEDFNPDYLPDYSRDTK